jgi:hypothetical protein
MVVDIEETVAMTAAEIRSILERERLIKKLTARPGFTAEYLEQFTTGDLKFLAGE